MSEGPMIYIDGEFYPKSQAKISVYDHGFLYGDGVFESIRAYEGVLFRLDEHLDRLYNSAKVLKIEIPLKREELVDAIVKTLKENRLRDAYIRILVTRGFGDLGIDPRKCKKPSIVIIAEPVGAAFGAKGKSEGISAIISSVRRDSVAGTTHEVKSMNYLNSILAKIEAIEAGADEAIMLDERGFVSEASAANIFIVKEGVITTPPTSAGILRGITRNRVIRLAKDLGYEVRERDITPYELITADEAFLTGTLAEIVPLVKVRGTMIGGGRPGAITRRIMEEFDKIKTSPEEGLMIY